MITKKVQRLTLLVCDKLQLITLDLRCTDECMLQQPNNDRQHQAIEGRARLSLAPASFRSLSGKIDEQEPPQPRRYPTYAETCEDRSTVIY